MTGEKTVRYVFWQEGEWWRGYLGEFSDHWTQAESLDELKKNLLDLYKDLNSGEIPHIRRVAELRVARNAGI